MTIPMLDPELVPLTESVPKLALDHATLVDLRAGQAVAFTDLMPPLSDDVERTDHVVSTDPHVVVRVHRPKRLAGTAPCLYSIHGGGYVLGSYVMDDAMLDRYCNNFGCVGVSVEYRLAPDTPYPGPLEDCYRGLAWTFENSSDLGIDATRVGLRGISAGGGLAAALALLARDRGEVTVAFQLLECPMIDDRQITPSSQSDDLLVWSREANAFGWQCYLGDLYGSDDLPAYAAPSRADDLTGLPPAFVITGGADGFRDENVQYALRLAQAGVPTDLSVIAGAPHGVQLFAGTTPVRRWQRAVDEWLQLRLTA